MRSQAFLRTQFMRLIADWSFGIDVYACPLHSESHTLVDAIKTSRALRTRYVLVALRGALRELKAAECSVQTRIRSPLHGAGSDVYC